jgi:hypothetical protein
VVRHGGDRLADRRQPLGLHQRRVVGGVLDREGRLVADGDEELQVVVAEHGRARRVAGERGRGVDVDRPHHAVAALHRHADRLADAGANDAVAGGEAVVVACVAGDHALAAGHHVVEDRAAHDQLPAVAKPVAPGPRRQSAAGGIDEHDAAPVGRHPVEHEVEDPAEELVDVERVADRHRRPVHHLQAAAGPGEPAVAGVERRGHGDRVVLADRGHDVRAVEAVGRDHVVEAGGDRSGTVRERQHRLADTDSIPPAQVGLLDLAVVEERAVGALQVGDAKPVPDAANLRVAARDLAVVEPDQVARLAADGGRAGEPAEVVLHARVRALDDEKRCHGPAASGEGGEKSPRFPDCGTGSRRPEARPRRRRCERWRGG